MASNMKKKTERVEANREKRPYAVAKYIRVSPYKVRTVLALIRGKSYAEAKAILDYSVNGSPPPPRRMWRRWCRECLQPCLAMRLVQQNCYNRPSQWS